MKLRSSSTFLAAIALASLAGSTLCIASPAPVPATAVTDDAVASPALDFRSSRWLSDRKVVNNNGEEVAIVSELIIDRGSGRIEYLVVKTGTTLGLGGRAVAIPYSAFGWETAGKDRFLLASTPEQLKQFPEYTAESWRAMKESSKDEKSTLRERLSMDGAALTDPYTGNLDTAKVSHVSGIIRSVERMHTSTFGEQVEVTIESDTGSTRRIALGPSWYVNGTAGAPMRGDKVTVDTLALPRDPAQLLVATDLSNGDHRVHLRASDGSPVWTLKTIDANNRTYPTPYSRYVVMSHLSGMKIDCRGSDCGTDNDIIIDRPSGQVAFISIDPNVNFLGINDTKRLVPWSVATVTLEGPMRIDASKEMVLSSPETPADLSALNNQAFAARVYKAFDVPMPKFEPSITAGSLVEPAAAWGWHGSVVSGIESGPAVTIDGKFVEMSDVKFENGVETARGVMITPSAGAQADELVLVGPAWYMDNQKPGFKPGDAIKVIGSRTMIGGKRYTLARSVECKGKRFVLLDETNKPAWDRP